jgi:hypothetical protein
MKKLLAASVVVLLGVAGGLLYLRQGPNPVTVDAAVKRYRAAQAMAEAAVTTTSTTAPAALSTTAVPRSSAAASRSAPVTPAKAATAAPATAATPPQETIKDGVYVYDTKGYEATSALGGARHDYPAQSTITVQHGGCGWTTRWQPLQERWEQWQFCANGAEVTTNHLSMYHEFFHRQQQQDFDCPPGSVVKPAQPSVGQRWAFTCTSPNAAAANSFTVLDTEPFTVAGRQVQALHIRTESKLTGINDGTQVQEQWLQRTTGVLLRRVLDNDCMADSPFGKVHYEEHYSLQLSSLDPSR